MAVRNAKATLADLEAVPEHLIGEILEGELVTQPRPAIFHAAATTALIGELHAPFQRGSGGPGGWLFMVEPELLLGEDVLVPDIAGWRTDRLARLEDTPRLALAPDWVCETLSPSTAVRDRGVKLRIYAREQVGHVWLLDPRTRLVEAYRREGTSWIVLPAVSQGPHRLPPFDAVELDLSALWAALGPAPDPA